MSTPLEQYALLSDMRTGPLVSRDGSIDWLCLPRFDSPAMFCALLGDEDDGRWQLRVVDGEVVERRYLPQTFVLETTWQTAAGRARVTDFLPPATAQGDLVRRVECLEGEVEVEHDLRLRFDYARSTPWTRRIEKEDGEPALLSIAGPDAILVTGPLLHWPDGSDERAEDAVDRATADASSTQPGAHGDGEEEGQPAPRLVGTFPLREGERLDWDLTWFPSHEEPPEPPDADQALAETVEFWAEWAGRLEVHTDHQPIVLRSLLVLRALTHLDTGGIVAAPTASLPEWFGGGRNWDYRYTWLRDAAFTIEVAIAHGLTEGASLWRDWLLRAVAGDADDIKIMYGLAGERQLTELELDHLAGYEESRPVRIGNGAADQYQADVVGEVMIALHELRRAGVPEDEYTWGLQKSLLRYCENNIDRKDHGVWEMRGEPHYFTHGRAMMWAAFDRGVRAVEEHGLEGPVERWRELRERLAAEVEEHGFDIEINSFTQTYDNTEVDASLLQLPHTGLLAYDDPRMLGTVERIERDIVDDHGLVHRYRTEAGMDGLEGGEYPFVLCTFWLVEQYASSGRLEEARTLMAQVIGYASDLGLFSEEYDPQSGRLAGNFPQAFSHLGLIRAADAVKAAEEAGTES
ncbi:Glucoamylase (glucan-1,4-alpha-glucosidase), GH15 family [Georgenia satyanarayanai]|uniref:Glucoamylase (Glucan-1,4-alpha-glucosidase), GH15 family n=1 Tax=Georgenia satyanarayanai TaxID=860221 RepID=A0A2Y9AJ34_9MICO|nr:glycoside hydrolase family 15 protein [Georgenia satyanarayanai]PYF99104.1 GH15 family glucan-1,4-alpha-glucosidase [Georgenia satyanarayanai]SSA44066.1 Glucoamylase (glucan-1,4-alpha-glucosidase), GH15 family [Georgenia satyanarayanai]